MAPKPTPRRSSRLTCTPGTPPQPSPPRRRPLASRAPTAATKIVAVATRPPKSIHIVPTTSPRASRALKRRRLSEELHNEYEHPARSIKRRKFRGESVRIHLHRLKIDLTSCSSPIHKDAQSLLRQHRWVLLTLQLCLHSTPMPYTSSYVNICMPHVIC